MESITNEAMPLYLIFLFIFGWTLFFICCYKISANISRLCHIESDREMPNLNDNLSEVETVDDINNSNKNTGIMGVNTGIFEMFRISSALTVHRSNYSSSNELDDP